MVDLIERQAAIDALMAWEEDSVWDEECVKHRGEPYWVAPSDVIEQLPPSAQPENVFEIGKPYPLKGFEFKIWKDAYGDDWVEIREYQESRKGEQDG
ncbi:MAG: hypothetical protein IIZ93_14700 [Acidaminococcaceae bacterium]|nr:hypothetical protein [Acidaminococcaceae bacterium]